MAAASNGQQLIAVVLAGGQSRRFGSDKLSARLGRLTVLEQAIAGLPSAAEVIVVGPARRLAGTGDRRVRFVREMPPGGGPAAALVAGLRAALEHIAPDARLVVLPGDAPFAGTAVEALLAALGPDVPVALATDTDGVEQPLQLALTVPGARVLVEAGGPTAGAGASARTLVTELAPARVVLGREPLRDVDAPADLEAIREHLRNADGA